MVRFFQTLLRYWHLLSLDAPTVAAVWCWAFGRAARLELAPWLPLALALGSWLFYVADRLLDARLAPKATLRERHHFHERHRRWLLAFAVPVSAMLALLVAKMPHSLLTAYFVLGVLSLAYLGVVHLPIRTETSRWFPKEAAVALLFASAAALPAWDEARRRAAGMPRHHPLLLLCPLFAALCWLNCMAIEDWERRRKGHRLVALAAVIIAAGMLSPLELVSIPARALALLVVLSAVGFFVLDRSRLEAGGRRIAADLVMLTPLLLLLSRATR